MSITEVNKDVYENSKVVMDYEQASGLQQPEQAIFQKYAEIFVGKNILDIGCGGGRTTEYLLPLAGRYIGIDYSSDMVRRCQGRFPQAQIELCDVRDMARYAKNQFDFVLFSFNGIDYIEHNDRLKALREIYRILIPDGYFMFSSHNREVTDNIAAPIPVLSLKPKTLIRNVYDYLISRRNRKQNLRRQRYFDDYALINDSAHNYALLTYYISPASQFTQLRHNGFQLIDQANVDGQLQGGSASDAKSPWVYYLCQKKHSLI